MIESILCLAGVASFLIVGGTICSRCQTPHDVEVQKALDKERYQREQRIFWGSWNV